MVKRVSLIKSTQQFTQQKNKIKYAFARDLISSYSVLNKEDHYAVKSLQDKYKGLTSENIAQKIAENFNFIINSFQSFFSDTKMVEQLLSYNAQERVTKKLIDRIKQFNLQKLALSTLNLSDNSKTITIPSANIKYTLSSTEQKQLPVSTQESLLSHPVDIAQNIIGQQDFNSSVNNNNLKLYKKRVLKICSKCSLKY